MHNILNLIHSLKERGDNPVANVINEFQKCPYTTYAISHSFMMLHEISGIKTLSALWLYIPYFLVSDLKYSYLICQRKTNCRWSQCSYEVRSTLKNNVCSVLYLALFSVTSVNGRYYPLTSQMYCENKFIKHVWDFLGS